MKIQFKSEYEDDVLLYNHCIKTEQTPQDYRTHYHDKYEILFLKEGNISYIVGDEVYPLSKNSFIFSRPNQDHCIRVDGDTPYDRYNLLFSQTLLPPSILAKIPDDLHVVSFDTNQLVIQLFEKMDYYYEKLRGDDLGRMLRALTDEIFMNVLIQLGPGKEASDMHPLTARAVTFIHENMFSIRDVDEICAVLSISKSYLYQLFLKDLRITPKRYIMEQRLNLARRELLLGAKAAAIYSQCGFTDYSAFFRAYKKYFGYPPAVTQKSAFVRVSFDDVVKGYVE